MKEFLKELYEAPRIACEVTVLSEESSEKGPRSAVGGFSQTPYAICEI